jgi:hypothetical protein
MLYFISLVVFNLVLIFISISLANTLYNNNLIDKSNRNSLILLSVCVPLAALITLALRYKSILTHLMKQKAAQ